jgi:hypothetical protein
MGAELSLSADSESVEAERELLDLVLANGDLQGSLEPGLVPGLSVCGTGQGIAPQHAVGAQCSDQAPDLGA